MELQLINAETAILANKKGYDYRTRIIVWKSPKGDIYPDMKDDEPKLIALGTVLAYRPTQALLQQWLRSKRTIVESLYRGDYLDYTFKVKKIGKPHFISRQGFETYEEALELGLIEGLKLINKK